MRQEEHCMIHLVSRRYKQCSRTDIASYAVIRGRMIPLCREHHVKVCGEKSSREWSSGT